MDKTVVVTIEGHVKHPVIGRIVRKAMKLKAHNGKNEYTINDIVRIMETRPLSKDKRWRFAGIIEKAK